jgi:hypothetical protein
MYRAGGTTTMAEQEEKPTLIEELTGKVTTLLASYNESGQQEVERLYVRGGWLLEPTYFANEAAEYWQAFLKIAMDHKDELRDWVTPLAVAGGMQLLFARLVWIWQGLEHNPKGLPDQLQTAIKTEVATFSKLVAR